MDWSSKSNTEVWVRSRYLALDPGGGLVDMVLRIGGGQDSGRKFTTVPPEAFKNSSCALNHIDSYVTISQATWICSISTLDFGWLLHFTFNEISALLASLRGFSY